MNTASPMRVFALTGFFLLCQLTAGCGTQEADPDGGASTGEKTVASRKSEPSSPSIAAFAGNEACRECHEDIYDSYQQTGHAHTLRESHKVPSLQQLDGYEFFDPYRNVTLRYHVSDAGIEVSIPTVFGNDRFPLQYALGSGIHGITCLTLLPDVDGGTLGLEHRVTWYQSDGQMRLTPGHETLEAAQESEMFGRIVHRDLVGKCVACHATTSAIGEQEIVDLIPNVGCESCHGPGRAHIAAMENGDEDLQIRFAAGTWQPHEEIAVCAECHRSVDDIPDDVITTEEKRIIRFQSVGLVKSECYTASGRAFSCVTCHSPHQPVRRDDPAHYEAVCLNCHGSASDDADDTSVVMCPVSPAENCLTCHMPSVEIIPGIHFADHWIRVRDEDAAGTGTVE